MVRPDEISNFIQNGETGPSKPIQPLIIAVVSVR